MFKVNRFHLSETAVTKAETVNERKTEKDKL